MPPSHHTISRHTGQQYEAGQTQVHRNLAVPGVEPMDSREEGPQARRTGLDRANDRTVRRRNIQGGSDAGAEAHGKVWATVTVMGKEMTTSPEVRCNNCGKNFSGGVTRIAEHITGKGVIMRCPCDNAAFLQLKAELIAKAGERTGRARKKLRRRRSTRPCSCRRR